MGKPTSLLILFLLCIISNVFPYHLDWLKPNGKALDDYGMNVEYDSLNDRIYLAGAFDTIIKPNDTISVPFLDAFSSNGAFLWRLKITGPNGIDTTSNGCWLGMPDKIAVDNLGFIYMSGECCNTILIDTILLPKKNGQSCSRSFSGDIFIAKFNPAGHALWAKRFECEYQCNAGDLAVEPDGIYLTGTTAGFIRLDSINLGSGWSTFICKFLPSGDLSWFKNFNGPGSILLNPQPNLMHLIISFSFGAYLDTQKLLNNAEQGVVFSTITENGVITIGSIYHNASVGFGARTSDKNGNLYIAGTYYSTTNLGQYNLQAQASNNFCIAKVNSNDSIVWVKTPSFCRWDASGMSVGHCDIKWLAPDRLFFTGAFCGALGFDSDTLFSDTTLSPIQRNRFDGFIFAFDGLGNSNWSQQFTGPRIDVVNAICQKDNSTVFLTGEFDSTAKFMGTNINSNGMNDAFLCRFSLDSNSIIGNPKARNTIFSVTSSKNYLGFISNRQLSNRFICYDLLGKRLSLTGTKRDFNLIGKLAIIHEN